MLDCFSQQQYLRIFASETNILFDECGKIVYSLIKKIYNIKEKKLEKYRKEKRKNRNCYILSKTREKRKHEKHFNCKSKQNSIERNFGLLYGSLCFVVFFITIYREVFIKK